MRRVFSTTLTHGATRGAGVVALVTASDCNFAKAVAAHIGVFDEVHGSDWCKRGCFSENWRVESGSNKSQTSPLNRLCRRCLILLVSRVIVINAVSLRCRRSQTMETEGTNEHHSRQNKKRSRNSQGR